MALRQVALRSRGSLGAPRSLLDLPFVPRPLTRSLARLGSPEWHFAKSRSVREARSAPGLHSLADGGESDQEPRDRAIVHVGPRAAARSMRAVGSAASGTKSDRNSVV